MANTVEYQDTGPEAAAARRDAMGLIGTRNVGPPRAYTQELVAAVQTISGDLLRLVALVDALALIGQLSIGQVAALAGVDRLEVMSVIDDAIEHVYGHGSGTDTE